MELHFRLSHPGARGDAGANPELRLRVAEDLTVGELADELARRCGLEPGASFRLRWPREGTGLVPARDELVAEAGPPLGATVELCDPPPAPDPPPASPATLVGPGGRRLGLRYGWTDLGPLRVRVTDSVSAHATGLGDRPLRNGEPLVGSCRLAAGDLLDVAGTTWCLELDGPPRPPAGTGPTRSIPLSRRRPGAPPPTDVELPTPPSSGRLPGFPVLSAAVPLLVGGALWFATRSLVSVAFVAFSFVFVVASGIESRREARAERAHRRAEFGRQLDRTAEHLAELRAARHDHDLERAPGGEAAVRAVAGATGLWRGVGDELPVRVGIGPDPDEARRRPVATGDPDAVLRLGEVLREHAEAPAAQLVDLTAAGGLAVIGSGESTDALCRSLVLQAVVDRRPDELELRVHTAADRAGVWRWTRWLPHLNPAGGGRARVVVLDGEDPPDDEELDGASLLWVGTSDAGVPGSIGAVVCLGGQGASLERRGPDGTWTRSRLDDVEGVSADEAELAARQIAPLRPASARDALGELPDALGLFELLGSPGTARAEDVLARWRSTGPALRVPIGRAGHGVVELDLRRDGPHALVAGTTGSGKSELLRTLVLAACLHHPPDRLNVLLVDYKGGAAFGPLADLPHVVGLVTDLDGDLAARGLRSLAAELRRRERLLAAHGAADHAELPTAHAPASLLVVVDEFAALSRELPGFVDGLVDLAQRGRSLGLHLVLATQRPAGVVSDAIRANTSLRLALRVTDPDDSRDVVDVPEASDIPRDRPGRALLRLAPGRVVELQTAHTGRAHRRRLRIADQGAPPAPTDSTELDVAVDALVGAAAAAGAAAPHRPWLDPLPHHVELAGLPPAPAGAVHIGLVDRPDEQRHDPLRLELDRDGGVLVRGAGGSGRTTVLHTVAAALRREDPAVRSHLFRTVASGDGAGVRGRGESVHDDVVDAHDAERVLRLLRTIDGELRRGRDRAAPRRLVLVDGWAAFEALLEPVNRGEAIELLSRVARDGRAQRVHVVVSATRAEEVPIALRAALGGLLSLRPATVDDATSLVGTGPADPDPGPPGRARVGADAAQVAVCADPPVPVAPERIPRLPGRVHLDRDRPVEPLRPLVGLDADELLPRRVDLRHHHALVAGPARSGRSCALATLAAGFERSVLVHLGDEPAYADRYDLTVAADREDLAARLERVQRAAGARSLLVAVDDLPDLLEGPRADEVAALLAGVLDRAREIPVRLAVAGGTAALARCYDDVVARIRAGRTGVLLGDDHDAAAALVHTTLPTRDELAPAAGRGWIVEAGRAVPAQLFLPPDPDLRR